MRVLLSLCAVVACIGSAACVGDVPELPRCDAGAAFGAPVPLGELATVGSREADLALVPGDENVAFFSRGDDVYTARRGNRAQAFGQIARVPGVSGQRPLAARDGRKLYFTRDGALFRGTTKIELTHDGAAATVSCPSIEADGQTLHYSDANKNWVQDLAQPATPSAHIQELDGFSCMVVAAGRREAFVRRGAEVYRTSAEGNGPWSAPAAVAELNSAGASTEVSYLSENLCDVYLTSTRSGVSRLYWAHRTPAN